MNRNGQLAAAVILIALAVGTLVIATQVKHPSVVYLVLAFIFIFAALGLCANLARNGRQRKQP